MLTAYTLTIIFAVPITYILKTRQAREADLRQYTKNFQAIMSKTPRNNLLRFPQSSPTTRARIDKRLGSARTHAIKTKQPPTKKLKTKRLERLSDFVRRIRTEKGLSLADVSKQSALFGPRISASYINRIETDPKRNPTAASLKSLAHGLGIPVPELFAHAIKPMSRDEADELALVTRFSELSPKRKSDVWALIQVLQSSNSPKHHSSD